MQRKRINLKKIATLPQLTFFAAGFLSGLGYYEFDKGSWYSTIEDTKEINICFTPPAGCGSLIAREIFQAKKSIYMQAFSFTSDLIAEELVNAHKRGIVVKILLDRGQLDDKNSKYHILKSAGIEVRIDHVSGLAHNKIIVIDKKKVITGSYNFTRAADKRNADNVIMIDNYDIAQAYIENWQRRYLTSRIPER